MAGQGNRRPAPWWLAPFLMVMLAASGWVAVSGWRDGNMLLVVMACPLVAATALLSWSALVMRRWQKHPEEVPPHLRRWWNS